MEIDSVSLLNNLIEISKDTEDGYLAAAENVEDLYLQKLLKERAENYHIAAMNLQRMVKEMDGVPVDHGSLLAAVHRGWENIKRTFIGKNDLDILGECERGEEVIEAAYKKVLRGKHLNGEIRPLLLQQYKNIIADRNIIRELKEKYLGN